jgi:hypothetical protein
LPQPLLDSVKNTIQSTARLFRRPNARHQLAALENVEHSIEALLLKLDQEELCERSREAQRRMLTSLHLIRTSLLDDETILATTVAGPQATHHGETLYAS